MNTFSPAYVVRHVMATYGVSQREATALLTGSFTLTPATPALDRDAIALEVLKAMLPATIEALSSCANESDAGVVVRSTAKAAYGFADAMIDARGTP